MNWLRGKTIALSVSPPDNMAQHGMGPEHLHDALGEISRQVLSLGGRLIYGGDLRQGGITRILFELAARYAPSLSGRDRDLPMIIDVVPYPMHAELTIEELMAWEADFATIAELRYMNRDGDVWAFAERPSDVVQLPTQQWADAFTAMRRYVTRSADARIVVGGKTASYLGRMPGVAEEAYISAEARQPLFVVGGFGGAAETIAHSIASNEAVTVPRMDTQYRIETPNGLNGIELRRLALSPHIDEIVVLLTRGLNALFAR